MRARRFIVGAAVMATTVVGGTVPLAGLAAPAAQARTGIAAAGAVRPTATTPAQAAAAIEARYQQLGGPAGKLGAATTAVAPIPDGYVRSYQHGRIYYGDQTGLAREVMTGPIGTRFDQLHGPEGRPGYPLTGPQSAGVAGGSMQVFAHGRIYYSAATDAQYLRVGHTLTRYLAVGGPAGKLGLPRSEVKPLPRTHGHLTRFAHGRMFDSGPTGSAREVMAGPIGVRFNHLGGAAGRAGFPLTGPEGAGVTGGSVQVFEHGRIYYSAATRARFLAESPTLRRYLKLGGPAGKLGMPRGEIRPVKGTNGFVTKFLHGRLFAAGPSGPTYSVMAGPIGVRFNHVGGAAGNPGFPRSEQHAINGGQVQRFAHGRIYYAKATHARYLRTGPTLTRYLRLGGPTSDLGMPDGEVRSAGAHNALSTNFAHGRIYHSSHGTWEVTDQVFRRYRQLGTVLSWLGVPVGPPRAKSYGVQQQFQQAQLQYRKASGKTVIRAAFHAHVHTRTPTAADIPYTYRSGCPVPPKQLRMLTVVFRNFNSDDHLGTIVVAASVVPQIKSVFKQAHTAGWEFRKVFPVDHYRGSDVKSMAADNTSAFNCRKVTGNPYRVSQHSYGNAIDINTFENPYVVGSRVYPSDARTYLNRANHRRGMIWTGDVIESRFRAMGWPWGARWSDPDYQHFSQNGG